ncbi:hypothetical protein [Oceanobacillus sp. CF4.6]|uniref:hypothetical protein n=1 Tax=Oceanobacillus sp. CF4.6 TaxID=3373080 RepID=UPI003EE715C9
MKLKSQNLIYILLREEEWNRGAILRKFIFTFLYSAMTACLSYLVVSDKIGAIIFFVVFFILRLLTPERTRKPKSSKSKTVSLVFLSLLVFFTAIWTASISIKVGSWLILFIMYFLEKIEKNYFISDNTSSHDL